MNRVRQIREAKGISLKELAQAANIMALHLQHLENYGWKQCPWGLETDERIAQALGVPVWELFPEAYYTPRRFRKEPVEEPVVVDTRTPEEQDEIIRILNEWRQEAGRIYDERDGAFYEQTQEGVWEGMGSYLHWQRMQRQRAKREKGRF